MIGFVHELPGRETFAARDVHFPADQRGLLGLRLGVEIGGHRPRARRCRFPSPERLRPDGARRASSKPRSARLASRMRVEGRSSAVRSTSRVSSDWSTISTVRLGCNEEPPCSVPTASDRAMRCRMRQQCRGGTPPGTKRIEFRSGGPQWRRATSLSARSHLPWWCEGGGEYCRAAGVSKANFPASKIAEFTPQAAGVSRLHSDAHRAVFRLTDHQGRPRIRRRPMLPNLPLRLHFVEMRIIEMN